MAGVTGARLMGLLLAWMALGFVVDGVTGELSHELITEALPDEEVPAPGEQRALLRFALASVLGLVGLAFLVSPPGEGVAPGVALGQERRTVSEPRRCWQCRSRWPAGAQACPSCGAQRLQREQ